MRKSEANLPKLGHSYIDSPSFGSKAKPFSPESKQGKISKFSSEENTSQNSDSTLKNANKSASKAIQSKPRPEELDLKFFYSEFSARILSEKRRQFEELEEKILENFQNLNDQDKISVKLILEKHRKSGLSKLENYIKALNKFFHVNFRIKKSDLKKEEKIEFIESELEDPKIFEEKVQILKNFLKKKTDEAKKLKKIDLFEKASKKMNEVNKKILLESLELSETDILKKRDSNEIDYEDEIDQIRGRNDRRLKRVFEKMKNMEENLTELDPKLRLIEDIADRMEKEAEKKKKNEFFRNKKNFI